MNRAWSSLKTLPQELILLLMLLMGLVIFTIVHVLVTGNIWFWGDTWTMFSFAHWYRLPNAIYSYFQKVHRPSEGLYMSTMYTIFGPNMMVFYFASLLTFVVACMTYGLALYVAFPNRLRLAIAAIMIALFSPVVSGTTYIVHTDNGRLHMLAFWLGVLAFQVWTLRSQKWYWLVIPIAFYWVSSIYEASALIIFTVPFFVYPVWKRLRDSQKRISESAFYLSIGGAVLAGFGVFILSHYTIFGGGHRPLKSVFPNPLDYIRYLTSALDSLLAPFEHFTFDGASVLIGVCLMALTAWLLFRASRYENLSTPNQFQNTVWFIAVMSLGIFFLGGTPYFLGGFHPDTHFIAPHRIYSGGGYGFATLVALVFTLLWQDRRLRVAANICLAIVIGFFAMFYMNQRSDWQEAHDIRETLFASLIEQVPNVQPNTAFLFIELEENVGYARVVSGTTGTNNYIKILYDEPTLSGRFLYLDSNPYVSEENRRAQILPNGVVARDVSPSNPLPFENLLIFRREGDKLVLLDSLSPEDTFDGAHVAIDWDEGVSEIVSNKDRILPASPAELAYREKYIGR